MCVSSSSAQWLNRSLMNGKSWSSKRKSLQKKKTRLTSRSRMRHVWWVEGVKVGFDRKFEPKFFVPSQIDDLKQQHNYDVKRRDLEIFKLQNKIEELERATKELDPSTQQLEVKLKATEEKLKAMTKSEEESQRVLKVRSGVIKELEDKMKGMQQQIEQLCCQVNRRHDFESEVRFG